jgi:hypothetical protein
MSEVKPSESKAIKNEERKYAAAISYAVVMILGNCFIHDEYSLYRRTIHGSLSLLTYGQRHFDEEQ